MMIVIMSGKLTREAGRDAVQEAGRYAVQEAGRDAVQEAGRDAVQEARYALAFSFFFFLKRFRVAL